MRDKKKHFESFEDFWPHYVLQHSRPETQAIHAVGTVVGVAAITAAVATKRSWLVPLGLVGAYGAAWYSHFRIEKNRPATFGHPLYSLAADFKMMGKILKGEMSQEVSRAEALRRDEETPGTIDMG